MTTKLTRRSLIATAGIAIATSKIFSRDDKNKSTTQKFCLNTSTVRDNGKPRPLAELIEITSKAGFNAIEPWILELEEFRKKEKLSEAKKRITDAGLVVPDAIGFAEWIVDDPARRKKGLEQAKRDMDLVQQIGGTHLAAPPVGATGGANQKDDPKAQSSLDLMAASDRYRALLDLGKTMGITPIVELWGFSKNVNRLGQAVLIASECGTAGGGVLPDVYHLYKGGSDFAGLKMLAGHAIGIFHVNDYPNIERSKIVDSDRVYPGDGIAPLKDVFATLKQIQFDGFYSLELFNRDYWKQDPNVVAKTGLDKLKAFLT